MCRPLELAGLRDSEEQISWAKGRRFGESDVLAR